MDISLYKITEAMKELEIELMRKEGELDEKDEQTLDTISKFLTEKTDNCAEWHQKICDDIEIAEKRKKEIERYIQYKKELKSRFEKYLLECMNKIERDSFVGELYCVKKTKPRKIVDIVDKDQVPINYLNKTVSYAFDKVKLYKDLKEQQIDGCRLKDSESKLKIGLRTQKD